MQIFNLRFVTEKSCHPEFDAYVGVNVDESKASELQRQLEDSITSYMENAFSYETKDPYKKAVADVMDACGHRWVPIKVNTILI